MAKDEKTTPEEPATQSEEMRPLASPAVRAALDALATPAHPCAVCGAPLEPYAGSDARRAGQGRCHACGKWRVFATGVPVGPWG
jgi:hypothetical protein